MKAMGSNDLRKIDDRPSIAVTIGEPLSFEGVMSHSTSHLATPDENVDTSLARDSKASDETKARVFKRFEPRRDPAFVRVYRGRPVRRIPDAFTLWRIFRRIRMDVSPSTTRALSAGPTS
jgi:hypothetical protein